MFHWFTYWAFDSAFWISGGVFSGGLVSSKPEWVLPLAFCRGEYNVHSLRPTSGATLANLLAAGTQPVLSPQYCCRSAVARIRTRTLRISCEPDALATELNRDRHSAISFISLICNYIIVTLFFNWGHDPRTSANNYWM